MTVIHLSMLTVGVECILLYKSKHLTKTTKTKVYGETKHFEKRKGIFTCGKTMAFVCICCSQKTN